MDGTDHSALASIPFTLNNAKIILQLIADYCKNNPIARYIYFIKDNKDLMHTDYVQTLIAKAKHDFNMLQLRCTVENV